jgi:8-oxo-dGTP pyrophosphatase MutT (NUDIX family)
MALVIPVEGPPFLLTAEAHPSHFGPDGMLLETMQMLVGGCIEHVGLHPPAHVRIEQHAERVVRLTLKPELEPGAVTYQNLVINEEGKLEQLPPNPAATAIAQRHGLPDDVIVGLAILLTDEEFQ